jgi:hypothetical protein
MDRVRLRMKLGEHEFEVEGPPAVVDAQFAAFRALLNPSMAEPAVPDSPQVPAVREQVADSALTGALGLIRFGGRIG